ncbi:MAG: hypothetical protein HUN04_24715 [Desulfobacter sp.]|nr:MAG: hypothetical protein HUN04_24715 [Desulfobacter sp.]
MEMISWTIPLAIMTGLTITAYKYPEAFRSRVAYPLLALSILAIVFVSVFNLGSLGSNVGSLVEEVTRSDARTAVIQFYAGRVRERYSLQVTTLLGGMTVAAYISLLIYLPGKLNFKK